MHITCLSLIDITGIRFFSSLSKVTDLFILHVLLPHLKPCDGILQRTQVLSISPSACLPKTSKFKLKFHHQVSFSKYKVAKFYINEFPSQYS